MSRSNFSPSGLNIGENNANMVYLYGISDFFSVMFKDTSKVNLLLEAGAEAASEIYSKFLQATSTISLEDIQNTLGQTIKLVTIKNTDKVFGEVNVYKLDSSILSSRYIANRPLLPTALMEHTVDYRIEKTKSGDFQIRFSRDISEAGFSTRLLPDGTTKEYAMWFVDTEIDERWISDHYAALIGVDPQTSTDTFKNFVQGLYYIYIHGPTLDLMRKGLNLCLGVPLAREYETVLEVRKYLGTDQYIVATDSNQYLIPYGLEPKVVEGDELEIGDELAQWVEVKDYLNDGDWWINLMIPPTLIPNVPEGQKDRYATKGSHFDYLMRNYLKKHTFLVNVRVKDSKTSQVFEELSSVIKRVRPSYTYAVYVWTVDNLLEDIKFSDEELYQRRDQFRCEHITYPIDSFYRNNVVNPLKRGCPVFIRYNVPHSVTKLCGTDAYVNGFPIITNGEVSNGFINSIGAYRDNSITETSWLRTLHSRGSESSFMNRGKVGYLRNVHKQTDSEIDYRAVPAQPMYRIARVPVGMKLLPLYTTTQKDIEYKCHVVGLRTPDLSEWVFDLLNPLSVSESINSLAINEGLEEETLKKLVEHYSLLMFRSTDVSYLTNIFPQLSWTTYAPKVGEINQGDYLIGMRIMDNIVGIYLVTSNNTLVHDGYFPVEGNDTLFMNTETRPSRGMGPSSLSPFYMSRGRGRLDYNSVRAGINDIAINESEGTTPTVTVDEYSDMANPTTKQMTRGGTPLVHWMEYK
jgi:hypothetical protein